jgi:3-dehydroquinate dehydratase-2
MLALTSNKIRKHDMANILVLHGPNLNLLGLREPNHYGNQTLQAVNAQLMSLARELGHTLSTVQSNAEAELIDCLHACRQQQTDFIIINPAAFTHTSIALRDALLAIAIPFVEVHLSNLHRRESFRQHSYFSDIAIGTITGLGTKGYLLALRYAHSHFTANTTNIRS